MVQGPAYKEIGFRNLGIPPKESWWMVQVQPTEKTHRETENPTNGSWWMVQIQPTEKTHRETENPPTAVGGIQEIGQHCA